jgi:hypothetical protein
MNIDWNWFFSAFAQCAAALIGIIAAFTISKLLSESEKVEDHSNAINEMLLFRMDLLRKIESRRFDWHDHRNIEYSSDLKEPIEDGAFDNLSEEDSLLKLKEIEPELFGVENCYRYLSEKISEVKSKLSPPPTGPFGTQIPTFNMPLIPPGNLWDNISKEKEKINNLKLESIKLTEWFKEKNLEVISRSKNTEPIKNTIYILIFGMMTTVIYPLHFMPLEPGKTPHLGFSYDIIVTNLISTKGGLLSLLALTIVGLFVYFLSIIRRIERQYGALNESIGSEHQNLSAYSIYFE